MDVDRFVSQSACSCTTRVKGELICSLRVRLMIISKRRRSWWKKNDGIDQPEQTIEWRLGKEEWDLKNWENLKGPQNSPESNDKCLVWLIGLLLESQEHCKSLRSAAQGNDREWKKKKASWETWIERLVCKPHPRTKINRPAADPSPGNAEKTKCQRDGWTLC